MTKTKVTIYFPNAKKDYWKGEADQFAPARGELLAFQSSSLGTSVPWIQLIFKHANIEVSGVPFAITRDGLEEKQTGAVFVE